MQTSFYHIMGIALITILLTSALTIGTIYTYTAICAYFNIYTGPLIIPQLHMLIIGIVLICTSLLVYCAGISDTVHQVSNNIKRKIGYIYIKRKIVSIFIKLNMTFKLWGIRKADREAERKIKKVLEDLNYIG